MIYKILKIISAVREVSGYTEHALGRFGFVGGQGKVPEEVLYH